MQATPRANRLHIGFFGKRNVGKSSLMNKLLNQDISIVSDVAGTTTDVVEKSMEFLPLGPVVFIDTAGVDDVGVLGQQRVEKTKKIFDRTDIAVIVCDSLGWDNFEEELFAEFQSRSIPVIAVVNKQDVSQITDEDYSKILEYTKHCLLTSINDFDDIVKKLKTEFIKVCPDYFIAPPSITGDLVSEKDTVVMVIPIDKEAPKGRLIMPQVQVMRDLLDNRCKVFITQVEELDETLNELKHQPKLVITDSQAFDKVSKIVPENIEMTSFSILFARMKGDLKEFCAGAESIGLLKDNDKILICESCSHHQIEDDIARVKIPNMLRKKTNKTLEFVFKSGHEFENDLSEYALIIHCGACMTNRKEVLSRILKCKDANVPITNYGITIAYCLGILERAIKPFSL